MKMSILRPLLILCLTSSAFAANNVVNMSHYDLMRPDFVAMRSEGIVGVIHEATFPRYATDWRYRERWAEASKLGLLWGAYHFGDATNPVRQADHFLSFVADSRPPLTSQPDEARRPGALLVLDFEKNGHYPGGTMSTAQAAAFVERIHERTGKYPGLYGSEYRLQQMLGGASASQRRTLSNCWLWIANYHAQPRRTSPWEDWTMWQYTGDGHCGLRPRSAYPISAGNIRKAERNIFNGNTTALQSFWRSNAWYP